MLDNGSTSRLKPTRPVANHQYYHFWNYLSAVKDWWKNFLNAILYHRFISCLIILSQISDAVSRDTWRNCHNDSAVLRGCNMKHFDAEQIKGNKFRWFYFATRLTYMFFWMPLLEYESFLKKSFVTAVRSHKVWHLNQRRYSNLTWSVEVDTKDCAYPADIYVGRREK